VPAFTPAAELCRNFHADIIRPSLAKISYAAGLFGAGSDVLGFDTERSTDHDWGPRACVFVHPDQVAAATATIEEALPRTYQGWPLRIGRDGEFAPHQVTVGVWDRWLSDHLGFDVAGELSPADWLVIPQQRLLEVVAGPVLADPDGVLADARARLAWYPRDVWWWLLACQWRRIAQEEAFVQRTAEVGDHLGSVVVAARLVRDAMRLALLIARRYAPYSKWLGSAFARLPHPDDLDRHLSAVLTAPDAAARQQALAAGFETLARRYLDLPGTGRLEPSARPFHDRPALVLGADRFVDDCLHRVADPRLRGLPLIGSVDQFADNTDLTTDPARLQRLRALYPG
jgi:hypothetical protein